MKLNAPEITIDPTKEKPWYVSIGEQLLQANKIRQVNQINKERLAQGLPPLTDAEMRSLTGTVAAKVELPQDMKNAMYLGGAALIGLLAFAVFKKRKRR